MQECSRKLHPLFHGLTGKPSGYSAPVNALKHYAIHKLSASVICWYSRNDFRLRTIGENASGDCICPS